MLSINPHGIQFEECGIVYSILCLGFTDDFIVHHSMGVYPYNLVTILTRGEILRMFPELEGHLSSLEKTRKESNKFSLNEIKDLQEMQIYRTGTLY